MVLVLIGISSVLYAQNPDYRVDKIINIIQMSDNVYDTLIQNFEYDSDGKLQKISTLHNNAIREIQLFKYVGNTITVTDEKNNFKRSYEIDSLERVVKYKIGIENYSITYLGNNVNSIESKQKNEGKDYIVLYEFKYTPDYRLINSVANTTTPPAVNSKPGDYDFYYFYNRDPKTYKATTVKRIDWGKPNSISSCVWRFVFQWSNDKAIAINKFGPNGALMIGHSYVYDDFGNISEEVLTIPQFGGVNYTKKYLVSYSKNKGNDHIIWQMSDWYYNKLCKQRTYALNKVVGI